MKLKIRLDEIRLNSFKFIWIAILFNLKGGIWSNSIEFRVKTWSIYYFGPIQISRPSSTSNSNLFKNNYIYQLCFKNNALLLNYNDLL